MLLAGSAQAQRGGQFQLGLRGGVNMSGMRYSSDEYDMYKHLPAFNGTARLFGEYRLPTGISFRLEGGWTARGAKMKWADVDYSLTSNNIDARLLMAYYLPLTTPVRPYVTLGGTLSFVFGGDIHYLSQFYSPTALPLNNYNINGSDFGAYIGVGAEYELRINRSLLPLSLEVGYGLGLRNNFSTYELSGESVIINNEMDIMPAEGSRTNHGLEVTIGVKMPTNSRSRQNNRTRRAQSKTCVN